MIWKSISCNFCHFSQNKVLAVWYITHFFQDFHSGEEEEGDEWEDEEVEGDEEEEGDDEEDGGNKL